jgi:hypothetical protein
VIDAYVYLQVTSIRNAIVQRLRRLRQPKYLLGAIVGGAYFYFFLFRKVLGAGTSGSTHGFGLTPEMAPQLILIAALVLLIVVVLAWFIPSDRAALQFTEAEVTFLFPAPMTRRMLIHCKLLRSQFSILVSSLFMALILRRGSFMGGNQLLHAAGWWLILSTLNLHFIGASVARERLLDLGINPTRRRVLVIALVASVISVSWWWLRNHLSLPTQNDLTGPSALLNYVGAVLGTPPVAWILAPFKWVASPLFAPDANAFLRAAAPAVLMLVGHYFWVVNSDVSFEEASIDVARRRAERVAALRSGNLRIRNAPIKPRTVPFALSPRGFAPIAFLWKGLIALGPLYRLRTWLIACLVVIVGGRWLAADPARLPLLKIFGGLALGLGGWLIVMGPMFMRRGLSQTLSHLDILKGYPLRGWQIVLGELFSPMAIMTFAQWLLLLVVAVCFGAGSDDVLLTAGNVAIGAIGIAFVAPPLCGLMLCVPFAGLLFFPAWSEAAGSHGGGVEVMGQRMIFFGAYLVALILALIPATLLGAIVFLVANWLSGLPMALALTALVGGIVLCAELAAAIAWLGDRIEDFDLAQEMPR